MTSHKEYLESVKRREGRVKRKRTAPWGRSAPPGWARGRPKGGREGSKKDRGRKGGG